MSHFPPTPEWLAHYFKLLLANYVEAWNPLDSRARFSSFFVIQRMFVQIESILHMQATAASK